MLLCLVQKGECKLSLDLFYINVLVLSTALKHRVDRLNKKLETFGEVTSQLEQSDTTIRAAWAYFDTVIEHILAFSGVVEANTRIFNLLFESEPFQILELHKITVTSKRREEHPRLLQKKMG